MKALILAGGFGTRLQGRIGEETPKPMADINGKPFIDYIIDYLIKQEIEQITLSLFHKAEMIQDYFKKNKKKIKIKFIVETEPLGTGGAVKYWIDKNKIKNDFLLINGDTLFNIDIEDLVKFHNNKEADISIATKELTNPYRYGTLIRNEKSRVTEFNEKKEIPLGLINCGVYIINPKILKNKKLEKNFSLEKDLLEKNLNDIKVYAKKFQRYFIDIGIPDDYEIAIKEIPLILE